MPTVYEQTHPVPARRHPLQLVLATWLLASGTSILITGPQPGSLTATLPTALVYAWAGGATFCSAVILIAGADRDPVRALYLELIAHFPLAVLCTAYAGAVIVTAGSRGAPIAGLLAAAGIGFGFRSWQVTRTLRAMSTRPDGPDG